MSKLTSVILIDSNDIDNFINRKILEKYNVTEVIEFKNAMQALLYLQKTSVIHQLILIDIYLPMMDGFEFINQFYELNLNEKQGKICLLSASINPSDKEKSIEKNVGFIEKPLTIKKLLPHVSN